MKLMFFTSLPLARSVLNAFSKRECMWKWRCRLAMTVSQSDLHNMLTRLEFSYPWIFWIVNERKASSSITQYIEISNVLLIIRISRNVNHFY